MNRGPIATWLHYNLFRTKRDAVLTVVFGALAVWLLYKTINFIFVTGRWTIIEVNLRLLMIGRYPEVHELRLAVTVVVLAAWGGLLAGFLRGRQVRAGRLTAADSKLTATRVLDLVERLWLPLAVVLLLLLLAGTSGPWITAGLAAVAAIVGRLIGPFFGRIRMNAAAAAVTVVVFAAIPIGMYYYVVTAVGFDEWGGFMLNLFLAVCSIVLCYPLGVLLALGRRSGLPLVRLVCTTYIELIRGAPLFVLLLLANVALGFFVPDTLAPATSTRAIVVFTLFTAAYMAEIIRGGLQSIPRGQIEAAKAVGLSPIRQTGYIVLPQALRNVIPAQIGQLISLFKDTTLAGIAMGLFELLQVSSAITAQPRLPGAGPDRRDADVRRTDVLGGVLHDEPREPAAREATGSRNPMSDQTPSDDRTPATRRSSPMQRRSRPRVMIEIEARRQALRRLPGAEGHQPERRHPRGGRRHRAVGLRQVDADPLHQPPRGARRRPHRRRRHRAVQRHPQHPGDPPRDRHGLPELQPLSAPERARQHHLGAPQGATDAQGEGGSTRHGAARDGARSPSRPASTRGSSRAASSSGWRSPARWR